MHDCLVGRCPGCGAVRMGRWLGDGEEGAAVYQADWEQRGFRVSREPEATIEPCRCEGLLAAVRLLVPDATPARVTALLECGRAVEQLQASGRTFSVDWHGEGWQVLTWGARGISPGVGPTLPAAVAAALGEESRSG